MLVGHPNAVRGTAQRPRGFCVAKAHQQALARHRWKGLLAKPRNHPLPGCTWLSNSEDL